MNPIIRQMVDILFQDVVENEETRALHDELMNNCQEHYQDLISSGMQEDEAAGAVMESLSGMQEVVDQYPKKAPAPETEAIPEEPAAPAPEKPADCSVWPADSVQKIKVDAGSFDVQVESCADPEIRVCCGRMERLSVQLENGTLNVQVIRAADQILDEIKKDAESESSGRSFMEMTLNEILQKAKSFVDSTLKNVSVRINEHMIAGEDTLIRISVPEALLSSLEINTASGDVRVRQVHSADCTVRSASGDICLDGSVREAIDRLFASSASGDIQVHSVWAKDTEVSAISGDVSLEGDFGTLSFKSVSGDVDFKGTAVSLKSKSVSGDVDLILLQADSGSISAEATSGDVSISLPADCGAARILTSTTIGEITCDLADGGASAPLSIQTRTVSGDIDIRKD